MFERTGAQTKSLVKDGDKVKLNTIVMEITGPVRAILKAERLALNFICRMSGIATQTFNLVSLCQKVNPHVSVAATRKTTPGFRQYEKKAVILGGGEPHRYGLYDMILIKDNHIKGVGSVEEAINRIREKNKDIVLEIEVENEEDAVTAAKMNVDWIMLDNYEVKIGKQVAERIRKINSHVRIEVSGGITEKNIALFAGFADRISLGMLTHSVKSKDFSLEISEN